MTTEDGTDQKNLLCGYIFYRNMAILTRVNQIVTTTRDNKWRKVVEMIRGIHS